MVDLSYWEWREIRLAVLERDKECVYCHKPLDIRTATIDHLIPQCKNGTHELSNLVAACKECNHTKDNLLPLEFIILKQKQDEYLSIFNSVHSTV